MGSPSGFGANTAPHRLKMEFYVWITGKSLLKNKSAQGNAFKCIYKVHRPKARTFKLWKKQGCKV